MIYQIYDYIFAVTTTVINPKNYSYGKEKCNGLTPKNASHRERPAERHRVYPRQDGTASTGNIRHRQERQVQDGFGRQKTPELFPEN